MTETIGNPVTWIAKIIGRGAHFAREGVVEIVGEDKGPIVLNQLHIADLKSALQKGLDDFGALRTDVMFIVVMYPIIGLLMVNFTLNHNLLPLLFPLVSGFALVGPVAAIGLYAMSRKREHGLPTSWGDAFSVITSPSFIPIATLTANWSI